MIAATTERRHAVFGADGLEPLPGACEAMVRFAHLPKVIVTGSSRAEAFDSLRLIGMSETFVAVFAAEDVPSSKPDPAGYLAAAERIEVPANECVVIEESFAGIAAGKAAGCFVVAVRFGNFSKQDQSAADVIIDTLDDLVPELWEGK